VFIQNQLSKRIVKGIHDDFLGFAVDYPGCHTIGGYLRFVVD
jgi:hypothetical protein